jgi:hypothetical protein
VSAVIATEAARTAGTLTPAEVRAAVARFLAPHEVATLARAALNGTAMRPILDELRTAYRGYAAGGVICTATVCGLAVEVNRSDGERGGVVAWRLLAQVVADGATPDRVAALDGALAHDDHRAAAVAADAIVLAGPTATQLDLLDHLADLADDLAEPERPVTTPPRRAKRTRTTTSATSMASKGGAR